MLRTFIYSRRNLISSSRGFSRTATAVSSSSPVATSSKTTFMSSPAVRRHSWGKKRNKKGCVPVLKQNESTGSFLNDNPHALLNQNLNILDEIRYYASLPQSELSIKSMYEFGSQKSRNPFEDSALWKQKLLLRSGTFLLHELPIRLAKRIRQLDNLPYQMSTTPSIQKVTQLYTESFKLLASHKKLVSSSDEEQFTSLLKVLLGKHRSVAATVAQGMIELKKHVGSHLIEECSFLQEFLEKFYMNRLGVRLMASQHIALRESMPGKVGIIDSCCRPVSIVSETVESVKAATIKEYGECPELKVSGDKNLGFRYIPQYIRVIMFELLKNSTRAVVEKHRGETLPLIEISIADGEHDVAIKISDMGGGISRKDLHKIWFFSYTTAPEPTISSTMRPECFQMDSILDERENDPDFFDAPFAGFGYGLPLSRLYARCFGGDVILIPMDGYGTDTYVYLNKIGNEDGLIFE